MANILKVLKGPLSTLGKKNRNGRIYSRELWQRVLDSEYWKDMITNNTLCGEVVHPGERTESDPFEIDVRNISHRVTEAHIEGDKLVGTVEVLDTEQGRNLASLIDSGCTVGISARGMGDVDGDRVIPDTYNFKCFDITMRPSDPNARLVPLTESEKVKLVIKESDETDTLYSNTDLSSNGKAVLTRFLNYALTVQFLKQQCPTFNITSDIKRGVLVTYDNIQVARGIITSNESDSNPGTVSSYEILVNAGPSINTVNNQLIITLKPGTPFKGVLEQIERELEPFVQDISNYFATQSK